MRKNLVITTIGKDSLHRQYCGENRNYDIMLIAYEREAFDKFQGDGDLLVYKKGRKFELIHHYLKDKELKYDYYLFLDDDILTTTDDLNTFFDYCEAYKTKISHPVVIGYNHHELLKPDKNYIIKYTDWTELQAVCFSRAKLNELLDTFTENKSGYGFPELWWKRSTTPWGEDLTLFAIVHAITIIHTRPYGTTYEYAKALEDYNELIKKHELTPTNFKVLARIYNGLYSVVIIFHENDQKHIEKCLNTIPPEAELILVRTVPVTVQEAYDSGRLWYKKSELVNIQKGQRHTFAEFHYLDEEGTGVIPDFAAARNAAKSLATREWILSIDADERFIPEQAELINDAIATAGDEIGGFITGNVSNIASIKTEEGIYRSISRQVRLFRRVIDWYGKAHESVEFSIKDAGYKIKEIAFCLFHTGYDITPEAMIEKLNRNIDRMLKSDVSIYKDLIKREIKTLTKLEENNNVTKSTIQRKEQVRNNQHKRRRIRHTPVYL